MVAAGCDVLVVAPGRGAAGILPGGQAQPAEFEGAKVVEVRRGDVRASLLDTDRWLRKQEQRWLATTAGQFFTGQGQRTQRAAGALCSAASVALQACSPPCLWHNSSRATAEQRCVHC